MDNKQVSKNAFFLLKLVYQPDNMLKIFEITQGIHDVGVKV